MGPPCFDTCQVLWVVVPCARAGRVQARHNHSVPCCSCACCLLRLPLAPQVACSFLSGGQARPWSDRRSAKGPQHPPHTLPRPYGCSAPSPERYPSPAPRPHTDGSFHPLPRSLALSMDIYCELYQSRLVSNRDPYKGGGGGPPGPQPTDPN